VLLVLAVTQACVDTQDPVVDSYDEDPALTLTGGRHSIGDVLPGTDMTTFAEAADAFGEIETIDDGLGPTFNETGCGVCHSIPVLGGSGTQIERRFGRLDNGVFFGYDADPENMGGTLRQLFSNGTYYKGATQCDVGLDTEPVNANVRNVGRRTTPLFGLGLVDAMPDWFFYLLAAAQPPSIRGVVQRVPVVLPDPRDPNQYIGSMRVGRFGWKGQVPTLLVFSGDAYDNEMGITTQSCFKGKSILDFADENYPDGSETTPGCNGGDLAPAQTAHQDVPEFVDDAVGPCDNFRTEIQDDLVLFTTFMERLAPPPRDFRDPIAVTTGGLLFRAVGCAGCHVTTVFVTPSRPYNRVPGNYPFQPFSDFLAHDMGSLGDNIGSTGDSEAKTRLMRTAPLWGARFNTQYLHDGRAPTIEAAILAHDGQGRAARDAFNNLSSTRKDLVVRYIKSL
jgi:CxxC motif-containing protein (DUF1111 family)